MDNKINLKNMWIIGLIVVEYYIKYCFKIHTLKYRLYNERYNEILA